MRQMTCGLIAVVALASCADGQGNKDGQLPDGDRVAVASGVEVLEESAQSPLVDINEDDTSVGAREVLEPVEPQEAPSASARASVGGKAWNMLVPLIENHFASKNHTQIYIQTDKPLYRPGETIWLRSWHVMHRGLGVSGTYRVDYQLISPKGAVVMQKMVQSVGGVVTNDFELPAEVPGGEYRLKAIDHSTGATEVRPVMVSAFEAPQIKKKLEFVHKAYGPGDEVSATLEVKRPTGEPLANKTLEATIRVDGQALEPVRFSTNEHGGAVVRFALPKRIEQGDGLLTIMVDDGGITESISRRVPIVLSKVNVKLFPEGGELVQGLPGRVYFAVTNTMGKPADVKGQVLDSKGTVVTTFKSDRDGMGRFDLTPKKGQKYTFKISSPVGIEGPVKIDQIATKGCVLRHFDDDDGQAEALRVSVRCTKAQDVLVTAMQRNSLLDAAQVKVPRGGEAVVYLKSKDEALDRAQGVARVTVWNQTRQPLAERLVYRNRRNGLNIDIEPDAQQYGPRDTVSLKIKTTDDQGAPVPAAVALSVVDDTVVSFADDKTGHMLSRLFLEQALGTKIEEPKFYFDLTEPMSGRGLDLLMGTKGWRRFAWKPVFMPPPAPNFSKAEAERWRREDRRRFNRRPVRKRAKGAPNRRPVPRPAPAKPVPRPEPEPEPVPQPEVAQDAPKDGIAMEVEEPMPVEEDILVADQKELARDLAGDDLGDRDDLADEPVVAGNIMAGEKIVDDDWQAVGGKKDIAGWARVRVFPVPDHKPDYDGPRSDFRDTIFWAPNVETDKEGLATVSFPMSDAVTSFRVFAEGVGGGQAGRKEEVLKSSLPFSMVVKLPLEVSAGDRLRLPLTLTNERDQEIEVSVKGDFAQPLAFKGEPSISIKIPAGSRRSLIFPVEVGADRADPQVRFTAQAGSLGDEFVRTLRVVSPGFPQVFSKAGQLEGKETYEVDLGEALPGSVEATVKFYPSPVATMVAGLEGMLRQPGGCFEQASSTNYPNLMVMRYLREHNIKKPDLWQRSGKLMDQGYRLLTGYESPSKGYEWFGSNPGHEALTAYGLMEFVAMKDVWNGVDGAMIERTAAWLKTRRDGKGGFLRNDRALDSFGRASKEVTDAYITYALTEGGFFKDFKVEIDAQVKAAGQVKDPYLLALATNVALNAPGKQGAGKKAAARLARMQSKDGSWSGADHSITRSGGVNLAIETTALTIMALLKTGEHSGAVRRGVQWLNDNRSGFGQWGATQATVLSLQAMTSYAAATRKTRNAGSITIIINGQVAREMAYKEGHQDTIILEGLGDVLKPGANTIEVIHESKEEMPFSVLVTYRSRTPATSKEAVIDLETKMERQEAAMGEVVRLEATVRNTTDKGQPMTLARVGLPGGFRFQLWQLKELKDKGLIGFFETKPREVILYLRDMKPSEVKTIPLDLVATVPGSYEAPASSAYLYYTDEHKTWQAGLRSTVTR